MNEKEFLTAYVEYVIGNRHEATEQVRRGHQKLIDKFIVEHHKEYYEVEFVRKDSTENYELTEVYVKRVSPIEFTAEEAELMLHRKQQMEKALEKKEEHQFDENLGPDLIVTNEEGKAIGVLEQGVNTLYNKEGKVIGWSNLTAEELRKMYNEVTRDTK